MEAKNTDNPYPRAPYVDGADEAAELVELDQYMAETGLSFEIIPCPWHSRRLRWYPKVGDRVSYTIRSDTYAEGVVVKATRSTFTTSTGQTFRWSKKRLSWRPKGGYGYAHPRTESRRDPHF